MKVKEALKAIDHACEASIKYSTKIPKSQRASVKQSNDAARICRPFYSDVMEIKEMFSVILTNKANEVIAWAKICDGTASSCIVDIQHILRLALLSNAQGLVLCHNHPSGQLNFSNADKEVTNKCKEAAKLMDITVLDSIVLTVDSYSSMADECLL